MNNEPTEIEHTINHQPAIPSMELPDYHGRKPNGMKTSLAGAGTRVTRAHTIGDRLVLVIEARVKNAGHEETDDGLTYSEKMKVLDLFELDGDQGARLLATLRSLHRTGTDAASGRAAIPDLGDIGYTDASGVVLTPAEVAEMKGSLVDPIRAVLSPELTPAVVVYADGARDVWPEDFPRNAPRPKVGESYLADSGEVVVVALLHHVTGEPIEAPPAADELDSGFELDEDFEKAVADRLDGMQAAREKAAAAGKRSGNRADAADEVEQSRTLAAVPPLPDEPDPFSAELGADVTGWETEERSVDADGRSTHGREPRTPTDYDYAVVDCQLPELQKKLIGITDINYAHRLLAAELGGRGRMLQPRQGALKWLRALVAEIEASSDV